MKVDKSKHIYSNDIKLEAEYYYNKNYDKIYNIKKLKREFKHIVNNLKQRGVISCFSFLGNLFFSSSPHIYTKNKKKFIVSVDLYIKYILYLVYNIKKQRNEIKTRNIGT